MPVQKYVRQLKSIQEIYETPTDKIQNFLSEGEMSPNEFAKYGGKRASVLLKAIDDKTPIETVSGTFPLIWINDSDRSKLKTAIGDEVKDYSSVF